MPKKLFQRVRNYFQGIANSFEDDKLASEIFPNNVDSGFTREDIFMAFLKRHIPTRCSVIKGGFVFDSQGNESKQLDLIITNDLTLNFNNFEDTGKAFSVIECCYAVISIKSNLTKEALYDSLDGFESLPVTPTLDVNPNLGNTKRLKQLPLKVIFAFNGIDVSTLGIHLEEYYKNRNIPDYRRVDNIIVNNKWIIQKSSEPIPMPNGNTIPADVYFPIKNGAYVGGFSLWVLLTGIQTISNFGSQILFNFHKYDEGLLKSCSEKD